MGVLNRLIRQHKIPYYIAVLLTFSAVFLNLCWNKFLMELLDRLADTVVCPTQNYLLAELFLRGSWIVPAHALNEFASGCLAAWVCEIFAHDLRMGYVRYYLQTDIRKISKMNVGEEQSAMQNELKDISDYFQQNLFSFMKQFVTFAVTALFLFSQNAKLTMLSILPTIPLMVYCYFTGKIIKGYTEQCQKSKKHINGLASILLELFSVIQVYDAYRLIRHVMDRRIGEWQDANIRKEKTAARLMSLSGLLSFLPLLLLLWVGGNMTISGEISLGTFYIFINLSGYISGFLQNMPNIYAGFRRFEASVASLGEKLVLEHNP